MSRPLAGGLSSHSLLCQSSKFQRSHMCHCFETGGLCRHDGHRLQNEFLCSHQLSEHCTRLKASKIIPCWQLCVRAAMPCFVHQNSPGGPCPERRPQRRRRGAHVRDEPLHACQRGRQQLSCSAIGRCGRGFAVSCLLPQELLA